eukprot:CAMPEP_0179063470 /NCGR_PEP_ID=MMETSP0796-20121207/27454_1 /TAXON_ID=73915 /ORGANISM="Pyrodinium bahamense, Strain pbaha01" /LENGTH=159 /DNA_ID=CAMNT_0020760397 /DNA_START=88 /DNA_END=567 /DNA_ORIENTATION=-
MNEKVAILDATWDAFAEDWNSLSFMAARVSTSCEWVFLILESTALMTLLVVGIHMLQDMTGAGMNICMFFTFLPFAAMAAWLLHMAAEFTEKCVRLPALVSSMNNCPALDAKRHSLVEFISYSLAGFYVKQVRLTGAMVFKCYYGNLASFGLLTRLMAQ